MQAKRESGTVQFGKPGGGAPHLNRSGQKQIRFREDPALRFQWTEDLRRTVDNTLRYRSKREEQENYKKQLGNIIFYILNNFCLYQNTNGKKLLILTFN